MITAILSGYNRPQNLLRQIAALRHQTISPAEILCWYNKGEKPQINLDNKNIKCVYSEYNFKFLGRFALALLAQTEYVAIFDDDAIPGKQWLENCLECITQCNGILGSSGVLITYPLDIYNLTKYKRIGCIGTENNILQQVDFVGHSWFFKRDWLQYLWKEMPMCWDNGEDIQFSFYSQIYGDINTFVPPQPLNNKNLWGSIEQKLNVDNVAFHKINPLHIKQRQQILQTCINRKWKLVNATV